jgi:NCS1 family nucleobase:cation symporter-1
MGAVYTGLLALLMQPWYVLEKFGNYIFTWLGTYGTLLGPFDGIAISDYWLVRSLRLDLFGLYSPGSRYNYARGWNVRAVGALIIGWIPPVIGAFVPALHFLWSGGWFFSIIVAGLAYAWLMQSDGSRLSATEYEAITSRHPELVEGPSSRGVAYSEP